MKYDEIKIYTDGGSRGNPGPSASGVVITTSDDEVIEAFGRYIGITTNNQAEAQALKFALEEAAKYQPKRIECYMDSMLVCMQVQGKWKIKNTELMPVYEDIKKLAQGYEITYEHVYRRFNKLADEQVNIAIDEAQGLKN